MTKDKTNIEEIKATILRPLSLALRAVVEIGDKPEDAEKCLTSCAEAIEQNYTPKDQVQAECEKYLDEFVQRMLNSKMFQLEKVMARQVGHTHSAINGVKNNNNAVLLLAHNAQRKSVDLPRDKTVLLDDIPYKLSGRQLAIVIDNYAYSQMLSEIRREIENFKKEQNEKRNS